MPARTINRTVDTSLQSQKVKAYINILQKDENFWNALLVFLGALFILSAIPFYPLFLVPFLSLGCAATAYFKKPYAGTFLSILLAFFAMLFQSTVLGLVFSLIVALTLFEMFEKWAIISALQIIIFAPFAPYPLSYLSGFVMLGMVLFSLHFGSKKSILISIPSVLLILLLSSIWLLPTSSFFYLDLDKYAPAVSSLEISKPAATFGNLLPDLASLPSKLLDFKAYGQFNDALGKIFSNFFTILFSDSGFIQLLIWTTTLFVISFLSGRIKNRSQTISSLFLFFVPFTYYFLSQSFGYAFEWSIFLYAFLSVLIIASFEHFNISFSRENEISKKSKMKIFGKFGLQDLSFGKGPKSLDEVGNYNDVKEELRSSVLMPLQNKEIAYAYGLKPPSGILLFGPPGTGKTMIMRAFSQEIGYPIYYIKSSDILSQWHGESEKNISELFETARKTSPCLLFFDEIDSIGKKRTDYGADDVGPRVLSVLLQEMDGFKSEKAVMVVGATNVPHKLDPALLRPGRLDKIIYMHLPDFEGRKFIFQVHLSKVLCSEDIDYNYLAKKSERFSGADIENVVSEAIRLTAEDAIKIGKVVPITQKHLARVLSSVKPSTSISEIEKFEQFQMDFERRVSEKEKLVEKEQIVIKWDDVAGLGEIKQAFLETIETPLLHENLIKEYNIKPSRGILLFGPPGTGKTLIAKAASNELKASFISISGAELTKSGYSSAVNILRETFNRARENKPSIIFIDEIETVAPSRDISPSDLIGQLLQEMDGIKSTGGVVVVAATNKPEYLDPAILRPGRFDKLFYVSPPDLKAREKIFQLNLGAFAKGLDLSLFSKKTEEFTGADIASLCQEVKMRLLRSKLSGKEPVITNDLVLSVISTRRPSVNKEYLERYERFLEVYGERK
ncbi:MAG: AAA family ATPase [Candidatus Micrarchaeia archaeon]